MARQNCWEYKNCGREPGGAKTAEFGVCPSATEKRLDGVNGGTCGGRACWAMTGTLCGGKVQGSYAQKLGNCLQCEFYKVVGREEGAGLVGSTAILAKLKPAA
jgi:hypothetical protein